MVRNRYLKCPLLDIQSENIDENSKEEPSVVSDLCLKVHYQIHNLVRIDLKKPNVVSDRCLRVDYQIHTIT